MSKLSLFKQIKSPKINNDYLDEVNSLIKGIEKRSFEMQDIDPHEMAKEYLLAQKKLQDKDVKMRRGHRGTNDIMKNGRFKNQFETGTSDGYYSPGTRMWTESRAFGTDKSSNYADKPKYGYVDGGSAEGYGGNIFTFKPHVKDNATFTLGDSLDDQLVGARYGFADWAPNVGKGLDDDDSDNLLESLNDIKNSLRNNGDDLSPYDAAHWTRRMKNATRDMNLGSPVNGHYHEVQFHGPLGIQDVSKLRLADTDKRRLEQARKAAQEYGFRLEVPSVKMPAGAPDDDLYWKCIENCAD